MLFAFAGGRGHAEPLVPLARAAEAAGHAVAFAGKPVIVPALAEQGFTAFPTGSDTNDASTSRLPLQPFDAEREARVPPEGFGCPIARDRAADLLALAAAWPTDLIGR